MNEPVRKSCCSSEITTCLLYFQFRSNINRENCQVIITIFNGKNKYFSKIEITSPTPRNTLFNEYQYPSKYFESFNFVKYSSRVILHRNTCRFLSPLRSIFTPKKIHIKNTHIHKRKKNINYHSKLRKKKSKENDHFL